MPRVRRGRGAGGDPHVSQPSAEVSSLPHVPYSDSWLEQQQVFLHSVTESRHAKNQEGMEHRHEERKNKLWMASLDFCTLGHHFSPFHKGFEDFSRRRIQSGVFKNPFPPCRVSQSSKKVLERCGVFLLVPKPPQSGRTSQLVAGLRVPDDHQVVDIEDQRGGALRGARDAVLRIFEAQELLHVATANFQGPT